MMNKYKSFFYVALLLAGILPILFWSDYANKEDCSFGTYAVGASSLLIRTRPDRRAEPAGLLREGELTRACPHGDEIEIDGIQDRWFALEDKRGYVFGGYLARPEVEANEVGPNRVFALDRGQGKYRVYFLRQAGQVPCKFDIESGSIVGYSGSSDEKYFLISPGTSSIRGILIFRAATCEMLVETIGLPQPGGWQGNRFLFEKTEWTDDGCIMTEFEFSEGVLTETGHVRNAGRGAEC